MINASFLEEFYNPTCLVLYTIPGLEVMDIKVFFPSRSKRDRDNFFSFIKCYDSLPKEGNSVVG